MVRTLLSVFGLTLTQEVDAFLSIAAKEAKHRGLKASCVYLKDLYTQAVAMSLGLNPEPIPFRKSNKQGFDRNITPFRKLLLSEDPNHKRAGLTILRQCYLIYCEPVPDLRTITSGAERDGVNSIIESYTAIASKWVPPMDSAGTIEVVPRAKSGPNSASSLMGSHLDAVGLSQRPALLQALADLAAIIDPKSKGEPGSRIDTWQFLDDSELKDLPEGAEDSPLWERGLKNWVLRLSAWTKAKFNIKDSDPSLPVSRLAFLAEGGCKTRIIAIGDLFTQATLRPVHQKLMNRLRKIQQDCTFDQDKAISFLKEATLTGPVYSFDLTAATDRFPIELQEVVIAQLFGKDFAHLWRQVLNDLREFELPRRPGKAVQRVKYKRGQGMGLYSSWPAFAYSHHVLLQWCGAQEGIFPFKEYRIIGDDVIIANREVAKRYRSTLDLLEVPISTKKSIVSNVAPYSGEVAKRLIHNGIDVSPIPPDLIVKAKKHVTMLPALVDEISRRYGLSYSTLSTLPTLVENFSRSSHKEKAAILLTAPLPFALWGGHPMYGRALHRGNVGDQEESKLKTLVSQTPWSRVDPEIVSDLRLVQQRIRSIYLLRQYDEVYATWEFFNPDASIWKSPPHAPGPRARRDKTSVAIGPQHPFWKAHGWLNNELNGLFQFRVSLLETGDEDSGMDLGLRHCLDPTLRSYMNKRDSQSKVSSHLTLEVFKILTGEKQLPEIEYPEGGLLTDLVKLTAH